MVLVSIGVPFRKREGEIELWGQLRREDGPLDAHWEFPGGKIEAHENPMDAVIREFNEEVSYALKAENLTLFSIKPHRYTDRSVMLYIFLVSAEQSPLDPEGWRNLSAWPELKLLDANYSLIKELEQYFKGEVNGTY